MRKIVLPILLFCFVFASASCTQPVSSVSSTSALTDVVSETTAFVSETTSLERERRYSIKDIQGISKKLEIPKSMEGSIGLIGLIDGCLIYKETVGDWPECNADYYKYNLGTDEKIKLGTLKYTNTTIDSYAYIDGNLYFAEDGEGGIAHCKLDTVNGGLTVFHVDQDGIPLVTTKPVNEEKYVELGGGYVELDDTQLGEYVITLCGTDGSRKDIVKSLYHYEKEEGLMINSIDVQDEIIYAVVWKGDGKSESKPYICTYDLSGKELSSVYVKALDDYAQPDVEGGEGYGGYSHLSVIDDYIFVYSLRKGNIVLQRTADGYMKEEKLSFESVKPRDEVAFLDRSEDVFWASPSQYEKSPMYLFNLKTNEFEYIKNFPDASTVAFDREGKQVAFSFSDSRVAPIDSHDGYTYLLNLEDLKKLYP